MTIIRVAIPVAPRITMSTMTVTRNRCGTSVVLVCREHGSAPLRLCSSKTSLKDRVDPIRCSGYHSILCRSCTSEDNAIV